MVSCRVTFFGSLFRYRVKNCIALRATKCENRQLIELYQIVQVNQYVQTRRKLFRKVNQSDNLSICRKALFSYSRLFLLVDKEFIYNVT